MKKQLKPTSTQIEVWVKKNFHDYKSVKSGGDEQIRINNPLYKDDGYHLWINLSRACVIDFRPTARHKVSGSFLWFVKSYKKISFREAVSEVMGNSIQYEYIDDLSFDDDTNPDVIPLPDDFVELSGSEDDSMVTNYLFSRCIRDVNIYANHVGRCGLTTVVFPYFENEKIVYWQSRSILNKKFQFPPSSDKSHYVFGIDNIEPGEPVIITESIFNALMFDRGVAIGGSHISDAQIAKLKNFGCDTVVVAFDNDDAGRYGVALCFEAMNYKFDLFYSIPPDEADWNDIAIRDGIDECHNVIANNTKRLNQREAISLKVSTIKK